METDEESHLDLEVLSQHEPFRLIREKVVASLQERGARTRVGKGPAFQSHFELCDDHAQRTLANWWIQCLEHHSIWQKGRQEDRLPYNAASLVDAGILPSLFELLCQLWVAKYRGESNLKAAKEAVLLIGREVDFVITDVKRAPRCASIQDEVKIKVEDTSEDFLPSTLHFDDTLSELSELSDIEADHDEPVNGIFAARIAVDEGTLDTAPEKEASADATLETITSNSSGLADGATRMDVDEHAQSSLTSLESAPSSMKSPTTASSALPCDDREPAMESPGAYDGGRTEHPNVPGKRAEVIAEDIHLRSSLAHEVQGAFEPSMKPEADPSSQPIADVEPPSITVEPPQSQTPSALVEGSHLPQAPSNFLHEAAVDRVSHHLSIPNETIVRPVTSSPLSSRMDPAASSSRSPKRQKKQSGPPGGSKRSRKSDKSAATGENSAVVVERDAAAPKVRNGVPAEPSKGRLPTCGNSAKPHTSASTREKRVGAKGCNSAQLQIKSLRERAKSLQASRESEHQQAKEAKFREMEQLKAQAIEQTRAVSPQPEPKPRRFKRHFIKINPPLIMNIGPTITSDDRTVSEPSVPDIPELIPEDVPPHAQPNVNGQPPIAEPVPIPQIGPRSSQAHQPDPNESQGMVSSQTPTSSQPPAPSTDPDVLKGMSEIPATEAGQPSNSISRTDPEAPSAPPEPIQAVVKRKRSTKELKSNAEARAIRRNPRRVVTQNPTRVELQIQQSKAATPQSATQESKIPFSSAPTADAPIEKNAGTPEVNLPMSLDLNLVEATRPLYPNGAAGRVQHPIEEPSASSLSCPATQSFYPTPRDPAHATIQSGDLALVQPPLPITEDAESEEVEILGEHPMEAQVTEVGLRTSLAGAPAQVNPSMDMDPSSQLTFSNAYPDLLPTDGFAPDFGTNLSRSQFWNRYPTVGENRHAFEVYNMRNNSLRFSTPSRFDDPYQFTNPDPISDTYSDLLQMGDFAPDIGVNNNIGPPMFGNQHPIDEREAQYAFEPYDMQNNSHRFGSPSDFDELHQFANPVPHLNYQYEHHSGSPSGLDHSLDPVRVSGGYFGQEIPTDPCAPEFPSLTSAHPTFDNNQTTTAPLVPDSLPDPPTIKMPIPKPPIWAQTRQEICEGLHYFRSWEGGVYFNKGIARGYLLDGFPSVRDLWYDDGRLIISHGGGASGSKSNHKHASGPTDQVETSPSVSALLRTYRQGLPIALLVGSECSQFPYTFPPNMGYVVLGYYYIKYAWAEMHNIEYQQDVYPVVRYKFAFEWMKAGGTPWWLDRLSNRYMLQKKTRPDVLLSEIADSVRHADVLLSEIADTRRDAASSSKELRDARGKQKHIANGGLFRRPPMKKVEAMDTNNPQLLGTDSFECPRCRHTSERVYEGEWMCLNPRCTLFWKNPITNCPPPRGVKYCFQFLSAASNNSKDPSIPITPSPYPKKPISNSTSSARFWQGWWCHKCGKLTCRVYWNQWYCSNMGCNSKVPSAIRITPAPSLARVFETSELFVSNYITRQSRVFHFAGQPIQVTSYVVPVYSRICAKRRTSSSVKLLDSEAAIHIVHGHAHINATADKIFIGYQEAAAEKDFFQRHVSHGLGGKSQKLAMYFSQNSGAPYQYVGSTRNTTSFKDAEKPVLDALRLIEGRRKLLIPNSLPFNEVLTAGYMEDQKMSFHSDNEVGLGPVVASLSLGSPALFEFRKIDRAARESSCLRFILHHGDILIMEGPGIQETYQHAAFPMGFRIAATARLIDPSINSSARGPRNAISESRRALPKTHGRASRPAIVEPHQLVSSHPPQASVSRMLVDSPEDITHESM